MIDILDRGCTIRTLAKVGHSQCQALSFLKGYSDDVDDFKLHFQNLHLTHLN